MGQLLCWRSSPFIAALRFFLEPSPLPPCRWTPSICPPRSFLLDLAAFPNSGLDIGHATPPLPTGLEGTKGRGHTSVAHRLAAHPSTRGGRSNAGWREVPALNKTTATKGQSGRHIHILTCKGRCAQLKSHWRLAEPFPHPRACLLHFQHCGRLWRLLSHNAPARTVPKPHTHTQKQANALKEGFVVSHQGQKDCYSPKRQGRCVGLELWGRARGKSCLGGCL